MWSTGPVAGCPSPVYPYLDGGGATLCGRRESDGVGAFRQQPGALRPEYAAPLCPVAARWAERGSSVLCVPHPEGAGGVGEAHGLSGAGYHEVVESVLRQSDCGHLSGAGGAAGVGSTGAR
jgi:hypothetical protein